MSSAQAAHENLPIEVDDAIVLLLGSQGTSPSTHGKLKGVTRLEKLIFLLQKESSLGPLLTEDPEFHAHKFGPFSSKIYQAVDTLEAASLIQQRNIYSGSNEDAWETVNIVGDDAPYTSREIRLTERGKKYFEALRKELPKEVIEDVETLKRKFGALPLRQLVRYVYGRYPAYTENSVIRDDILG